MNEQNLLDEAADKFGSDVVENFWVLVDGFNWSITSSKKEELLRDLTPQQAVKYRAVLKFLSEGLAKQMTDVDSESMLAATLAISNEIGTNGEDAVWCLLEEKEIGELNNINIDDSFLYDFPTDDDYWA